MMIGMTVGAIMKEVSVSNIDRILIVEDDPISAMVLRRGLENRGFTVTAATNGQEALEALGREDFRIVISDWMMPQMDGLELCRRVRGSGRGHYTYFILLTAKSQKEDRTEGLRAGVDDYLLKPLDTGELEARLRVATRILNMQENLHRLALVARKTNSGVVMLDSAHGVEWVNEAFARMTGWTEDEARGKTLETLVAGHDGGAIATDEMHRGFERSAGFSVELQGTVRGGEARWMSVDCTPILDEKGAVSQYVAIVSDVTERKQQQEQIRKQFERITALRAIDIAINFGRDLGMTLAILLDQIPSHVGVDAAAILELDRESGMLLHAASRGFRGEAIRARRLKLGESCAGKAAVTMEPIVSSCPDECPDWMKCSLHEEGFQSYVAVPMTSRGEVVGVLEVFHRKSYAPDSDQQEFLVTVANQAAIAIVNARLLSQLQLANQELSNAYDATIEGWSRALDLRDQETEGHSQRVTELTLRLAESMGFDEEALIHVRRGALLHDIGKMGVPDSILLKPGPLCQEEWELMRRHPIYAFEMLSPIQFLNPALDIPYCHHEKWDGTGYPRGLAGDEIPLAARIFAIVDVWDALRSDRPYRQAWSTEQTSAHIRSLSGTHFDPRVAEEFLRVVAGDDGAEELRSAA
jgi:PAS domain S-box-containing protein/putative nucleotidyltransferase with HDIG domain